MKTPEQIAAETTEKINDLEWPVGTPINAKLLVVRWLILAALTEHAKGLEEEHEADKKRFADSCRGELVQLRADAARLEQQLHALRLVCGTTDANKFEAALDRANTKIKELEARILSDNKAYGCELRDPYGTIWEYAETLKKRVAELEAAPLGLAALAELKADKARLDWLEANRPTSIHHSPYPDMGGNQWSLRLTDSYKSRRQSTRTLRAAIDAARSAQPAANTGDNHRMGGSDNA